MTDPAVPAVPAADLPPPAVAGTRFDRLDLWRGLAIVWMAGFHFCFDLNLFRFWHPFQYFVVDPFWTNQRFCIVSMFLLGAGASQAVAVDAGQSWPRFWRRWLQVAGCAVLVSLATIPAFPRSWISFGVLHGIAVMLVVLRLLGTRLPPARLATSPLATVALAALAVLAWHLPRVVQSPALDGRLGNWTGLVTRLPFTEDYVPVFPWLGMMLAGYLAASLALQYARPAFTGPVPAALRPLSVLGRWSLSFYMVHQPLLWASLYLVRRLFP